MKLKVEIEDELIEKNGKQYTNYYMLIPRGNGRIKRISLYGLGLAYKQYLIDFFEDHEDYSDD